MTKQILVIDDHPETVRLIEITLRRHGYKVVGAQSGAEGIKLAQANPPDLILLDVMMPDMDGLTVCRRIREQEQLQDLPIVMFTAKTQVQDKKASFEAGADDYLTKPTRPAELISRVEAILARAGEKTAPRADTNHLAAGEGETPPEPGKEERFPLIAVLGARGGAGATTVALNLAVSLADNGHQTLLVDLDTRQGHIATYLGHEVQQDVGTLLKQAPDTLALKMSRYLTEQGERLHLLLAHAHMGQEEDSPRREQIVALTAALRQSERHVVVDMGHNSGRHIYPLLQRASHIIICLRSERVAITATKQLIDRFRPVLSQPEKLHALMLDFGLIDNLPRRSVENYLGFPLLDVLSLQPQSVTEAVNRDTPLVHLRPHSPQAEQFHALARQLVPVQS